MSEEKNTLETPENRFLDLQCIPDFKIKEVEKEFMDAYLQQAKQILDEMLQDPIVKGRIRKKILKCVELLEKEN